MCSIYIYIYIYKYTTGIKFFGQMTFRCVTFQEVKLLMSEFSMNDFPINARSSMIFYLIHVVDERWLKVLFALCQQFLMVTILEARKNIHQREKRNSP